MADLNTIINVVILLATAIKTNNFVDIRILLQRLKYLMEQLSVQILRSPPLLIEHMEYGLAGVRCGQVLQQVQRLLRLLSEVSEDHMSQDLDDHSSGPESGFESDSDESNYSSNFSEVTAAAMREFIIVQQIEDERLKHAYMGKLDEFVPREDWPLIRSCYDDKTADVIAREALAAAGDHGSIACIYSPKTYKRIRQLKASSVEAKCLQYDKRFKVYGADFIFFDYSNPLDLDISLKNHFDVVVVDPPRLSEDCFTKTAIAVKFLAKDKIILCTDAVMESLAYTVLQVSPCEFKPRHENNLQYNFLCYTNYESASLQQQH